MADLNEVRLIGRLTRDPELRSTAGGQTICTFGLATGRRYKGQDGEMREETTFVDVTCWGKLAETVPRYMKKGSQLFVGGRLKFDSWEDKQSGQKRSKLSVTAENIQFLDAPADNGQQQQPRGNNHAHTRPPASVTAGMAGMGWDEDMGAPPF